MARIEGDEHDVGGACVENDEDVLGVDECVRNDGEAPGADEACAEYDNATIGEDIADAIALVIDSAAALMGESNKSTEEVNPPKPHKRPLKIHEMFTKKC